MEITALAQFWVKQFLRKGDLAIDATVGNGYDTAFLARAVGSSGRVFGFDVQQVALEAARRRLLVEGIDPQTQVKFFHRSHAEIGAVWEGAPVEGNRRARAIMFNFGYLPGGDKTVTTKTEETMKALENALPMLEVNGGIMTLVLYPGHPEGEREAQAVLAWAGELPGALDVTVCRPWNRKVTAPFLIVVEA